MNWTSIMQGNYNISDHDATSTAVANSGGNGLAGLVALNVGNTAAANSAALNFSPVSQSNSAIDLDFLNDMDGFDFG